MLPETYSFTRGTSRQAILEQMQKAAERALAAVWEKRSADSILASPRELVTLASIVEKETGQADERPRVAGVFVNRLKQGIRLQSDPTIIYGLVAGAGTLGRPIRRSDIDSDTPYNTYKINGLPPGTHRQPRPSRAGSCRQSDGDRRDLFRRRRHWWASLRQNAGRA